MNRSATTAILAVLAAATAWAPSALADGFTGTLAARQIHLQGDIDVLSSELVTRLGADDAAMAQTPRLTLSGERITVDHYPQRWVAATPGGLGYRFQDPTVPQVESEIVRDASVAFEVWQLDQARLTVQAGADASPGEGALRGALVAPIALKNLREAETWTVGPQREVALGVPPGGPPSQPPVTFMADAGDLSFDAPEYAQAVTYRDNFRVVVYGATFQVTHAEGSHRFETGTHATSLASPLAAETQWINVTVLTVLNGALHLEPAGAATASYAGQATLAGTGTVMLQDASGNLADASQRPYLVEGDRVSLVGSYRLSVRGDESGGFVAGVAGDFERSLIPFANAASPSGGLSPAWWLLALGVVAAGGATATVLVRRRRSEPAPQAVPAAAAVVEPVADAAHMEPGFTWGDLSEQFGVIRAGERAGVIVVLVPANRVERFLQAVVARGLIAEDTGDRVHAGDHELAVVALEPSPVMMN